MVVDEKAVRSSFLSLPLVRSGDPPSRLDARSRRPLPQHLLTLSYDAYVKHARDHSAYSDSLEIRKSVPSRVVVRSPM